MPLQVSFLMRRAMAGLRILFLGDLVGAVGMALAARWLPSLVEKHSIDAVIINGENIAAKGRGIHPKDADALFKLGAKVITTGNHIWALKEIYPYINEHPNLIRPANFPDGAPGKGFVTVEIKGTMVTVINAMGRTFFRETLNCPFKKVDEIIAGVRMKSNIIFVDFHAEATSEKTAMGFYLDGKVSAVVGTHSHVQTADERVLPAGTAYITDVGSAGARNSCLGVEAKTIISRYLTQLPATFAVDLNPPYQLNGVVVDIDRMTGKANSIERIFIVDDQKI